MSKLIEEFSIEDKGFEHSQHFQGAGVACTDWDECEVGCGGTPHEAREDALVSLTQGDWDVNLDQFPEEDSDFPDKTLGCDNCLQTKSVSYKDCEQCEFHHYVVIYVKGASE